ncbi:alpha/beta hydrolase [Anaerocolumna cellulosilytica]|nr:alpha/beta hydrolase-fold protein [Anaerocolumna cellulosilytica]MBB5196885.1 enterochelin esterase-like enzyme [Anaerocolumna cellulosilytica]
MLLSLLMLILLAACGYVEASAAEIESGNYETASQDILAAAVSYSIPTKYTTKRTNNAGTIRQINYTTYDYFGNNSQITKPAYVYLPYGYNSNQKYNVLYLMHGIGGNEREWGMFNDSSTVKIIMDNLIYYKDIDPFIIVTPNGRSSKNYANTSSDHNSFYKFGQELRNDLIPYIDKNFSTYANYNPNYYDKTAARGHRAMAGLSMGGMQTINIGICESLDLISNFGAFSAAPTTYNASRIANTINNNFSNYNINTFYNMCGTSDGIAWASATGATNGITSLTNKLTYGNNLTWQAIQGGGHDFNVWYLGFYNFARMAFK